MVEKVELLTTAETLALVGCARSTLYFWQQTRGFPKPIGRMRSARYVKTEVEEWIRCNKLLMQWLRGSRSMESIKG